MLGGFNLAYLGKTGILKIRKHQKRATLPTKNHSSKCTKNIPSISRGRFKTSKIYPTKSHARDGYALHDDYHGGDQWCGISIMVERDNGEGGRGN